jgi:hypothetical protein
VVQNAQCAFYLHIDDGLLASSRRKGTAQFATSKMIEATETLEAIGFKVPDRQTDDVLDKVVGYEIARTPARFSTFDHGRAARDFLASCAQRSSRQVDLP